MSIVKEFSRMLSSIPHDQAFTQLLITQIMTFYDKCCGWYKGENPSAVLLCTLLTLLAIVTKVSHRDNNGVRLKAAASYVEPGPIRDVISELRAGNGNKAELIDKVSTCAAYDHWSAR